MKLFGVWRGRVSDRLLQQMQQGYTDYLWVALFMRNINSQQGRIIGNVFLKMRGGSSSVWLEESDEADKEQPHLYSPLSWG